MADVQILRLDRGFPGGFPAGTVAKWINVSRATPIPADWLERSSVWTGPIPADIPILDAAGALAAASCAPATPPPDRRLTSEQLWQRLPWTRDASKFELACAQFSFPRPIPQSDGGNLLSLEISRYVWSERDIDQWIEAQHVKIAQLREFLGIRK
jgi:hypothetical protein